MKVVCERGVPSSNLASRLVKELDKSDFSMPIAVDPDQSEGARTQFAPPPGNLNTIQRRLRNNYKANQMVW